MTTSQNTSYQVLFDSVLSKIKDYDFFGLEAEQVYSILSDYIRPAIVRFQSCKKDLTDRDDILRTFHVSLSDTEIEILSDFMVVEYLDANYIRVPEALKMILGTKDANLLSSKNLLKEVMSVRNQYLSEANQLTRDYSYIHTDLFQR